MKKLHNPHPYNSSAPQVLFNFLLLASGVLCEELAHEAAFVSSLLWLKHKASSTPIGLWGRQVTEPLESFAEPLFDDNSFIILMHFNSLS